MIKLFWHKTNNFGDAIAPMIVKHFTGEDVKFAKADSEGKMISTGSVLHALRRGDTVWGTGLISPASARSPKPEDVKFLAVRGPLTAELAGTKCKTFGDPGLLLPLIYKPEIKKTHELGIIPHYIEKQAAKIPSGAKLIDIQADWKTVIHEILSCERIMSSSLHGIIAAEAYGIPVAWTFWTTKIIGGMFKYQDYFLGTGRPKQEFCSPVDPIGNIGEIQTRLLKALQEK